MLFVVEATCDPSEAVCDQGWRQDILDDQLVNERNTLAGAVQNWLEEGNSPEALLFHGCLRFAIYEILIGNPVELKELASRLGE